MKIKTLGTRDFFKYYKETVENRYRITVKRPSNTDKELAMYRSIVTGFFKFISQKILDGYLVQLSNARTLGQVNICGRKKKFYIDPETGQIKGALVDYNTTRKVREQKAQQMGITYEDYMKLVPKSERPLIFHLNEHSNYIFYKAIWLKNKMSILNMSLYIFDFSVDNKKRLGVRIKEGKEYYVKN
jgi:hypothetical protein